MILVSLLLYTEGSLGAPAASERERWSRAFVNRLSPVSTILVSVTADEISALAEALPFQFANVTLPEQHLAHTGGIGSDFTHKLASRHSTPMKKLRTSAVQCVDRPLKVKVINSFDVRCLEGGVAALVSLANVHVKKKRYYGHLVVHYENGGIIVATQDALPLAALNPFLWANDMPRSTGSFRGTAICLKQGGRFQVVEGWPVRAPSFKEGPWDIKVLVERAFLTPSSDKKQHLLHAELKVLKVPRDVTFLEGPRPVRMPFAGYLKLPSKYHGLEAAIIRQRITGRACHLKRTEPKSVVELKCDDLIDAKIASLNKLYHDRPPLLHTFKGAGFLTGGSIGAFALAAFMQMLGNTEGSKPVGDPEGCMAVGAISAIVALLTLMVDVPKVSYQYWRWKKKYSRKAARIAARAVSHEAKDPTTKGDFLDLVFVIPPVPYGTPIDMEEPPESLLTKEKQDQLYRNLTKLIKLRAELAALEALPLRPSELEDLGIHKAQKETQLLQEIEVTSAATGLRLGDDDKEILPQHLSTTRMYGTIADLSKLLIEDLASLQPEPTFGLKLLMAQLTRQSLWHEWNELRGALNSACRSGTENFDTVPLMLWAAIHEKLAESGTILKTAQLEAELKKKLQAIQREQTTAMRKLLEERVQEEVAASTQVIANLDDGETENAVLPSLENRIANLKAVIAAAGLSDKLLEPLLYRVTRYAEDSKNEVDDWELVEDSVPGIDDTKQPPVFPQPDTQIEEDDSDIMMIEIDDG